MAKPPKIPRPPKPPFKPLRDDHIIDPTITPAQKELIGSVVESWSKLEYNMDDLIWAMLKLDFESGKLITNRMDAVSKIRLIRQLGPLVLTETQFHTISPVMDRVDILREDRNFIIHGTWGMLLPENIPICSSLRPSTDPDQVAAETFPDTRMMGIAIGIQNAVRRIGLLRNELPALPDKSGGPLPAG